MLCVHLSSFCSFINGRTASYCLASAVAKYQAIIKVLFHTYQHHMELILFVIIVRKFRKELLLGRVIEKLLGQSFQYGDSDPQNRPGMKKGERYPSPSKNLYQPKYLLSIPARALPCLASSRAISWMVS